MAKKIYIAVGVDVVAVVGWLGSDCGQVSPNDISRGMFAGEVGVPRLLQLAQRRNIPFTWFWPGHSIETFPEQFDQVVAAGHEIGHHGYAHENPLEMSPEQETEVFEYVYDLIERRAGTARVGYVAPWCDMSHYTNDLWANAGMLYDASFMLRDFTPDYVRVVDTVTNIDY